MEFLLFPSCISGRAIINEFFDYRQLINFIIMHQFTNKEQPRYQLERYLASPSLSIESLNNREGRYSGAFEPIPEEVFLLMVDYLNDSNRRTLGQVCGPFCVIIWLERPPIRDSLVFLFPTEIQDSRKKDSYELCMKFDEKRVTYKDNTIMGPVCYFGGIMNRHPPQFFEENPPQFCKEENPPQWNVMTLEGETNDDIINELWVNYLGECINLHFLKLVNVNNIFLHIRNLTKLETLFMKLKPVNELYASIIPPSSVKAIVVSTSEENNTLLSERCIAGLDLGTLEGTRLDIW
jgi:hypothetical protein